MDCGLMWPFGNSHHLSEATAVPLHSPNGTQIPADRAGQGKCWSFYLWANVKEDCISNQPMNTLCITNFIDMEKMFLNSIFDQGMCTFFLGITFFPSGWEGKNILGFSLYLTMKPCERYEPCSAWCIDSFVYTSGHCCRWHSHMEVKIVAWSLFVHRKIAYFYSVTAEKCLIISLPNFVTMRETLLSISCKIFSWIRTTKLKIHAIEFCNFIKDFVIPSGLFVPCSLTMMSTWRPRLTAHCPIGERH